MATMGALVLVLFLSASLGASHFTEWMHGGEPLPATLASRSSTLSPEEESALLKKIERVGLARTLRDLCSSVLTCTDSRVRGPCANVPYRRRRLLDAKTDSMVVCDGVAPAAVKRFFLLDHLSPNSTFSLPPMYENVIPGAVFLPHTISRLIPFTPQDLPTILHTLRITLQEPRVIRFMESTLTACSRAPSPVETKKCTISLYDLSTFVSDALGTTHPALLQSNTSMVRDRVLSVSHVSNVVSPYEPHVTCHAMAYPYMVHYCHYVQGSSVYVVHLKSQVKDATKVLLECHDGNVTKLMPKNSPILTQLGITPGEGHFCHFISETTLIFTK